MSIGFHKLSSGLVLLVQVDVLHFVAVDFLGEALDLLPELLLALELVLPAQAFLDLPGELLVLHLLLLNHAFQRLHQHLQLAHGLGAAAPQLDGVFVLLALGVEPRLACQVAQRLGVLFDEAQFRAFVGLVRGRELGAGQFVLLEISDALLEAGVLEVELVFLVAQVPHAVFGFEEVSGELRLTRLRCLQVLLQALDSQFSHQLHFFSFLQIIHGLPNESLDLVFLLPEFLLGVLQLLCEPFVFPLKLGDFALEFDPDGFVQLVVLFLQIKHLVLVLLELLHLGHGHALHLGGFGRLGVQVDHARLEGGLLPLELGGHLLPVLDLLLYVLRLFLALLDLLLQGLQLSLVLLLDFPVLESATCSLASQVLARAQLRGGFGLLLLLELGGFGSESEGNLIYEGFDVQ